MKVKKQKPLKAKKAKFSNIPFSPYIPAKKMTSNLRKKKFTIETEGMIKNEKKLLQILKKIAF